MTDSRLRNLFLNLGHGYDHLFILLFPTVVLGLEGEFQRPYSELLALAVPGFIAFAAGTLPAGWLGDRWSRPGMIAVFFIGIGTASILTGLARSQVEIAIGLTLIGLFASIYHPVGIALLVQGHDKVGKLLGVNGVWGNVGIAAAALVAAGLMDLISWRAAFIVPGVVALATGFAFVVFVRLRPGIYARPEGEPEARKQRSLSIAPGEGRRMFLRVLTVLSIATVLSGLVFQSSTIALPKLFEEGLGSLGSSFLEVGLIVSAIVGVAAFSQIIVGHLIDRFPAKPIWIAMLLAQAPLLILVGMTFETGLVIVTFAAMVLILGEIPIGDALVARYTAEAWRSRVYGVKFTVALGASAVATPLVAFMHASGGGFTWLFVLLAAFAAIVGMAAFWLPTEAQRRAEIVAVGGDD